MITIATAALLSCSEAKDFVRRIDSRDFTRRQYIELVNAIASTAPRRCRIVARPHNNRVRVRHARRHHYHHHPFIGNGASITFRF